MRISAVIAIALFASSLHGQAKPRTTAWMTWKDFKVVISPDSSGETVLWLTADSLLTREPGGRVFFGSLHPTETVAWVKRSREFLTRVLTERDTGDVRISDTLSAKTGEKLYLVRRRYNGKWTDDRFLVFTDSAGRAPALLDIDVRLPALLDSLEAVAGRTTRVVSQSSQPLIPAHPVPTTSPLVAAWLGWKTVLVGMAPDSIGVHLWVASSGTKAKNVQFFTTFAPPAIEAWIADARDFLSRPIDADTGKTRNSPILKSLTGDGLYIARRRKDGAWSDERFLIMDSLRGKSPVMIASDVESVRDILDSLQAVARRTPFSEALAQRLVQETTEVLVDEPAVLSAGLPLFPFAERYRNPNGLVVVSYIIDADGQIDMSSVQQFFSTSPEFLEAVATALPTMRYKPGKTNGKPIKHRVILPIQFSIVR